MRDRFGTLGKRLAMLLGCATAAFLGAQVAASLPGDGIKAPPRQPVAMPVAAKTPALPPPAPEPTAASYVVRRVLPIKAPFRHGDWYWDEAGAPDGEIVVTVDLKAQVLSVFRAGYEIGTAVMIYGADTKPTPLGVFAITQKDADHVSSLYDAPMPYMMRLTNDGVSIHGSPSMRPDAATHGCVGVPTDFARKLFGVVKLGTRVIVSNGETLGVGQAIKAA